MIDPARMKDEFLDLAGISSLSRREGAIARRLESILKGMGASVEVDDAGEKVGGETGNLLARFTGTKAGAPPFLTQLSRPAWTPPSVWLTSEALQAMPGPASSSSHTPTATRPARNSLVS